MTSEALFALISAAASWLVVMQPAPVPALPAPPPPTRPALDQKDRELLDAVRREIAERGFCTPEQFEALAGLHARRADDADVRTVLTQALLAREDWDALVTLYSAKPAAQRTPQEQMYLVKLLVRAHRYAEAGHLLAPLMDESGQDPDCSWVGAYLAFHRGDLDEAAALLDRGWNGLMAAGRSDARVLRSLIFLRQGEHDRAIEVLEPLLAQQPDNVSANNAMGRIHAAAGRPQDAAVYLQRAQQAHARISGDETRQARLSSQARALSDALGAGRLQESERLIQDMLPHSSDALKSQLYLSLSEIYRATGRTAEAEAMHARSVELRGP